MQRRGCRVQVSMDRRGGYPGEVKKRQWRLAFWGPYIKDVIVDGRNMGGMWTGNAERGTTDVWGGEGFGTLELRLDVGRRPMGSLPLDNAVPTT